MISGNPHHSLLQIAALAFGKDPAAHCYCRGHWRHPTRYGDPSHSLRSGLTTTGPTAFGRIPGFKATIFPQDSMVMLTLTANLGLVLFLFLVGLEVDMRMLTANYKVALSVAALGMIIPFGLGVAVAYGLYNQFVNKGMDDDVPFGIFVLFIGVAMAITVRSLLTRPPAF